MSSEHRRGEPPAIRRMRPEDLPKLDEILLQSPETVRWIPDFAATSLSSSHGFVLVSESPRELTGLLVARQAADEAEILNLAVRPANRRTGTATALLTAAIADLRTRNATRVFLEVRESNAPAIAFYQKHAFRQIGTRPGYYRQPDEAALNLQRILTA